MTFSGAPFGAQVGASETDRGARAQCAPPLGCAPADFAVPVGKIGDGDRVDQNGWDEKK